MDTKQFEANADNFKNRLKPKYRAYWDMILADAIEQFGKTESALAEALQSFDDAASYNFEYC